MKKCEKGTPGYLREKLKLEILRTVIYFMIVAAVFLLGYSQTHSKKNLLTVVAVVGCLPACKALVGVMIRFPYRTVEPALAEEVAGKSLHLTVIYDLVITSTEKIMPVDCIAVSGDKVFGYASNKKTELKPAASFIRKILQQNGMDGVSVKLFDEFKPFIAIVEGLENIAAVEKGDTKEYEAKIADLILNISL